jgi:hypothetical protein
MKQFSKIISSKMLAESANSEQAQAAVEALIKKMGYNSIDELKKEKALISKLENLMKEFSPKSDISEDEAEDIEDETVARGKPKSLENKSGKKEEGGEVGTEDDEVTEDEAEDIEDEVVKRGEPKQLEEDDEDEIEEDEAEDIEDEVVKRGEPKQLEEDEAEDIEDEVLKRGEPKDKSSELEDELEDEVTVKGKDIEKKDGAVLKTSKRILSFDQFIAEETVNKNVSYQDDEEETEDNAVPVSASYKHKGGKSVNEAEIKSDEEFKEYVSTVLKKAFGDKFDQAKADEVADGLISKHSGDYGAMVGALQASLG